MTGEEVVGPAGPKVVRLLYFFGAGYICTAVINKWRDIQRKSFQLPEKLSNAFFMQAKTICPSDPHMYNKLGVVAHHMKEYKKAVQWFEKTLAHIPSSLSEMWEPTVVNLAHSLRKLKRYHEVITYYEKALALSARSLSTYAGLAYTYHLQDNFTRAITYYHKVLWLKPDDKFCTEMLTLALVDECCHAVEPKTDSRQIDLFLC